MQSDLTASIVRILKSDGSTAGTGFVVSARGLVATCAHVVKEEEPNLVFPSGQPMSTEVVTVNEEYDVAFLRPLAPFPERVAPAEFAPSVRREGATVRAFGYPKVGDIEGLWGVGQVVGYVTEAGRSLLQLSSTQITAGFSGGPVWNAATSRVIGMVVQITPSDRYGKLEDVAFAIPAETLRDLSPEKITLHDALPFGAPFHALVVPRYFVPRPEVNNELKAQLLADEATAPGALVLAAIHGLGGIGKTTLVAALAHDPDVHTRFPDGVLWTTLGQQPDVISLLVGWIRALHDYDFRPTVIENASNHLRTLLYDKACLLVVDDAWQANHVRPFLVGGERCRVLVTTRDATLARKVGARLYALDVMTEAQALALFEARLGRQDDHQEQAAALAHELGYLPLALELAAAQVEAGVSWDELLNAFQQELVDLKKLELDEATYRNESLRLSFRLSLDRLCLEDQQAYAWLGVLPEEARLGPIMAATLWGQPEVDARKRLRRMQDKALLKRIDEDRFTIHDLLHCEAKLRLTQRTTLAHAHAVLVERYRELTQGGLWHTLPDDGYIHEHLMFHMEQSGQSKVSHALLREQTGKGLNGWYEARDNRGETAGYLADVCRAWRLADQDVAIGSSECAVSLQCRYALITASVNSIAHNIPPQLITALVKKQIWSTTKGLAYALQVREPLQMARGLTGLLPLVDGPERELTLREALAASRMINDPLEQVRTLMSVSPYLPRLERQQVLAEALAVVSKIENEVQQSFGWRRLAPHLPDVEWEQVLHLALDNAEKIQSEFWRQRALATLARYLPASLLTEALSMARRMKGAKDRAGALIELLPHASDRDREQVLSETLQAIQMVAASGQGADSHEALVVLLTLFDRLIETGFGEAVLAQMQAEFKTDRRWDWMAGLLASRLAPPTYPEEILVGELEAILRVEDAASRASGLVALVPHLSCSQQEQAMRETLQAMKAFDDDGRKSLLFGMLAPYLSEQMLGEALAMAETIEMGIWKTQALEELAPYLSESLLTEALRIAVAHDRYWSRTEAFDVLDPYLSEPLLLEALASIRAIRDEKEQARALGRLASYSASLELSLPQGQDTVVEGRSFRVRVQESLIELLPKRLLALVLSMALGIYPRYCRVDVFAWIAPRLPQELLDQMLVAVWSIWHRPSRAEALGKLAPYLSDELLTKTLATVLALEHDSWKLDILFELAPHLPDNLLRQVFSAVREIESDWLRITGLTELAPSLLTKQLFTEELTSAHKSEGEPWWDSLLARLPLSLAQFGFPVEAQTVTKALAKTRYRAKVMARLSLKIAELGYTREAMTLALTIDTDYTRAVAIEGLTPYLLALPRATLSSLWCESLPLLARRGRPECLSDLAVLVPVIFRLGGRATLREVSRAIQDVGRWWP